MQYMMRYSVGLNMFSPIAREGNTEEVGWRGTVIDHRIDIRLPAIFLRYFVSCGKPRHALISTMSVCEVPVERV